MKQYLITGGAGFIGSNLADKLIEQGHRVAIIDNLSAGKRKQVNKKARFHHLDILDYKKIRPAFDNVDFVFHLAAIPSIPLSVADPIGTSKVNILGTVNVFKAAVDAKVKRVVFASSSAVYGQQPKLPFRESMEPDPVSPYGLQKLAGEQFAKLFTRLYPIEIICLRYFNVYGPRIDTASDYSLVLGKFLQLARRKKPLTIFGDGRQTRAFCYISDVVDANIRAMHRASIKPFSVMNIGQDVSYSIRHLAALVGGPVAYLKKREGDALRAAADIRLAKKLIGWKPAVGLEEGVSLTREWFLEHG